MTIRFFILSAHYRGTVDFSSEALEAAEKGLARLMGGLKDLKRIQPAKGSSPEIAAYVKGLSDKLYSAMNDDMQTPIVISELFEACHQVNLLVDRKFKIGGEDLEKLSQTMHLWIEEILGLVNSTDNAGDNKALDKVMKMVLDIRAKAKADKDWATSDKIRDNLNEAGIIIKDTPDGTIWEI
jgi:cysteinyl-tRNA synthetase